jgi:Flp pilus assembly CpaE family ATPase
MISQFFISRGTKLQIVLNRYMPQTLLFDDKQIERALTKQIDWKVPDDYASARRTQNTATPLAMEDSPISRAIRRMARKACGLTEEDSKAKGTGLLGWARRGFGKLRSGDDPDGEADDDRSLGAGPAMDAPGAKY